MIDRKPYPVAIEKQCEELYDMLIPHVDALVIEDIERNLFENNPNLETILGSFPGLKINVAEIYPDWYQETFTDMMRDTVQDAISIYF